MHNERAELESQRYLANMRAHLFVGLSRLLYQYSRQLIYDGATTSVEERSSVHAEWNSMPVVSKFAHLSSETLVGCSHPSCRPKAAIYALAYRCSVEALRHLEGRSASAGHCRWMPLKCLFYPRSAQVPTSQRLYLPATG